MKLPKLTKSKNFKRAMQLGFYECSLDTKLALIIFLWPKDMDATAGYLQETVKDLWTAWMIVAGLYF